MPLSLISPLILHRLSVVDHPILPFFFSHPPIPRMMVAGFNLFVEAGATRIVVPQSQFPFQLGGGSMKRKGGREHHFLLKVKHFSVN